MRITKWGEYGILCSLYLAGKELAERASVSAQEISDAQGIPIQYTHQILQRLRKGDIIKSVRGPKGGFCLARPAKEVNLKQILEASEGATFEIICETAPPYGEHCGQEEHCSLSTIWRELKVKIDEVLTAKDLASLAAKHTFLPGRVAQSGDTLVTISPSSRE